MASETKFRRIDEMPARLFVIGDLHACPAELESMLSHLTGNQKIGPDDILVFIGDYIDRGPDSKAVVDKLLAYQKQYRNAIFLRGNHEDMLLGFLGAEGSLGPAFLQNGGTESLRSYGIKTPTTGDQVLQLFPPEHVSFFFNLDRYLILGDYVFVHAGLNPLRDLESQLDQDLFWIRDPFINNVHRFNKTVVFGHTPYQEVLFHLPFKIGLDTGLVYGNKLTCLELVGREIFQIGKGSTQIKTTPFAS